jgi:hypothetical protein
MRCLLLPGRAQAFQSLGFFPEIFSVGGIRLGGKKTAV